MLFCLTTAIQTTQAYVEQNTTGMTQAEIKALLLGALLTFVFGIITRLIERYFDRKGHVNIYYRITNSKGEGIRGWGFDDSSYGYRFLEIPVDFELQNTTNVNRVIRDLCLILYMDDTAVAKMEQIECAIVNIKTTTKDSEYSEKEKYFFGREKGSYSFFLPPRSIQKQECEFLYKVRLQEMDRYSFNKIKLKYFDEKDKEHCFDIKDIPTGWDRMRFEIDEEWNKLSIRRR